MGWGQPLIGNLDAAPGVGCLDATVKAHDEATMTKSKRKRRKLERRRRAARAVERSRERAKGREVREGAS
jgi:hypothetical protein